jgi:hypothetical protein
MTEPEHVDVRIVGADFDEAVRIAAKITGAKHGCVEVRPVADDEATRRTLRSGRSSRARVPGRAEQAAVSFPAARPASAATPAPPCDNRRA